MSKTKGKGHALAYQKEGKRKHLTATIYTNTLGQSELDGKPPDALRLPGAEATRRVAANLTARNR